MCDVFSLMCGPGIGIFLDSVNYVINFNFLNLRHGHSGLCSAWYVCLSVTNKQLLRHANEWIVCCLLSAVPGGLHYCMMQVVALPAGHRP